MARIRTIKPEFWTDDTITECSLSARLLFIGIWNFADDAGNLDRSAKQIKARVFPVDNVDCEALIQELLAQELLIEYSVSDKKYLHIPGFADHQVINRPSKPVVPGYEESLKTHGTLTEPSVSTHAGREGKGMDTTASATPKRVKVSRVSVDPEWFLDFKLAYPNRTGDQGWRKALKAANARIAEGHSPAEFIEGAKRYAQHCAALGKVGTEFVKQAATFLGPEKSFLETWGTPPPKGSPPANWRDDPRFKGVAG